MANKRYDISDLRQYNQFANYSSGQPSQDYSQQGYSSYDDPTFDEGPAQNEQISPDPFPLGGIRSANQFEGFNFTPNTAPGQVNTTPPATTPPKTPGSQGGVSGLKELMDLTNGIYTPQTSASERYNRLLDEAPEINKPSLMRSIMAAGINVGANAKGKDLLDNSDRVNYAPYLRDQAAWKEKTGPYQQAAQLENSANSVERQLASGMATNLTAWQRNEQQAKTAQDKLDETIRANKEREANNRTLARIREYVAMKWIPEKDGDRWIAKSPDGKQIVDLGSSSGMDRADEIAALSAARASEQLYRGPNGEPLWRNPDTGRMEPYPGAPKGVTEMGGSGRTGTGPGGMSMQDSLKEYEAKLKGAYISNPTWREHIEADGSGGYVLKPPPEKGMFERQETFDKRMKSYESLGTFLLGAQGQQQQPPPQASAANGNPAAAQPGVAPSPGVIQQTPPKSPLTKIQELEALLPTLTGRQRYDAEGQLRSLYTQMAHDMKALGTTREQRNAGQSVGYRGMDMTQSTIDRIGGQYADVPGMPEDVIPPQYRPSAAAPPMPQAAQPQAPNGSGQGGRGAPPPSGAPEGTKEWYEAAVGRGEYLVGKDPNGRVVYVKKDPAAMTAALQARITW